MPALTDRRKPFKKPQDITGQVEYQGNLGTSLQVTLGGAFGIVVQGSWTPPGKSPILVRFLHIIQICMP